MPLSNRPCHLFLFIMSFSFSASLQNSIFFSSTSSFQRFRFFPVWWIDRSIRLNCTWSFDVWRNMSCTYLFVCFFSSAQRLRWKRNSKSCSDIFCFVPSSTYFNFRIWLDWLWLCVCVWYFLHEQLRFHWKINDCLAESSATMTCCNVIQLLHDRHQSNECFHFTYLIWLGCLASAFYRVTTWWCVCVVHHCKSLLEMRRARPVHAGGHSTWVLDTKIVFLVFWPNNVHSSVCYICVLWRRNKSNERINF